MRLLTRPLRQLSRSLLLPAALALSAGTARAGDPSELPPTAQAIAAIHAAASVRAAEAGITAEEANRQRLEAGTHEWNLRLESQQRRVLSSDERFREWSSSLERPIRLPGKAGIDRELGEQGVQQARVALEDARHEAARLLLRLWFGWLRESEIARQWSAQADLLGKEREAVASRLKHGDASKLEAMQAAAAQAQAAAEEARAQSRREVAKATLAGRFPTLVVPAGISLSEPQPVSGSLADWQETLLANQHELRLARSDSERMRLLAKRADAERLPDPTLGLRLANERRGDEKVAGLVFSLPLPGGARRAQADAATAYAAAAAAREAGIRDAVTAEIASLYATASAAWHSWQQAEQAARQQEEAATLTGRARTLGEAGLADVLLSRRLAHEARLAAQLARLDALESRHRLELDAHRLWADDDDDTGHAH